MSADQRHVLPVNIFQTVFEKSPGSILIKADKPRFTILAASDSYLEVTATTRAAILGRGFSEVFPDSGNMDESIRAHNVFTKVIETGQKVDIPSYRYDIYDPDSKCYEVHHWSCSNVPIPDDDNNIAYILNTVVDITEEVKAKETAIESESRLRVATEVTGLATWELNLHNQGFIYSARLPEIFGHKPDTALSLADVRSQISDDDMENVVKASFKRALLTGEYLYEVKNIWPDGSVHWIKTQGVVIYDEDKRPVRMLGTILDITENKRDEIRKNDFIAMASHELKTPLTSLKAYIQLLAKKIPRSDDAFVNNALIKANSQVNKMADLIYGFLDLSRLEAGKLQVKIEHFDINKLIEGIIAETLPLSNNHDIVFKPGKIISAYADREKIEQVINNFLSNAIKYSPKESTITVRSKVIDNHIQVSVTDMGIGIKPRDQEKLFQRFYRVDNDLKTVSGFGIGLYLASEIVQRHKGKIWVESEDNEGSTFFFSLPLV